MTTVKPKKKQKLRNAEYFDLQDTFDKLYSESKKSKSFTSLMDIVAADKNIMLVLVSDKIHILIHATDEKIISAYTEMLHLDAKQKAKLNKLRRSANLFTI